MKLVNEKIQSLEDLYLRELLLLLSSEEMIAIKSAFLVDQATDGELKQLLRIHWFSAESRAAHLRNFLPKASSKYARPGCPVVYALFDEAETLVQDAAFASIVNLALPVAARRIKHYEAASYRAVLQLALALGRHNDAQLLEGVLQSVYDADRELSNIANSIGSTAGTIA